MDSIGRLRSAVRHDPIEQGTNDLTNPYYFALEATKRAAATGIPHVLITVPGGGAWSCSSLNHMLLEKTDDNATCM